MDISIWSMAIILCKGFSYVGISAAIGGVISGGFLSKIRQPKLEKKLSTTKFLLFNQIITFISLSIVSIFLLFMFQTGAMLEDGLKGMFDIEMLNMMWDSPNGESCLYKVTGLFMSGLSVYLIQRTKLDESQFTQRILRVTYVLSIALLAYSFSTSGHTSELTLPYRLLIIIHVIAMGWWFGSLWPLYIDCFNLDCVSLKIKMEDFGKQASLIVIALLSVGGLVAAQLINSVDDLFTTTYGQVLIIKLLLVILILKLALMHKLVFVPALLALENSRMKLVMSIRMEMILALSILLITIILTTLVSPQH